MSKKRLLSYKEKRKFRDYDQMGTQYRIIGFADRQMGRRLSEYSLECAVSYGYWREGWERADRFLQTKGAENLNDLRDSSEFSFDDIGIWEQRPATQF